MVFQIGLPRSSCRDEVGSGILPLLGLEGLGFIPFAPILQVVQADVSTGWLWPFLEPGALTMVTFVPGVPLDPP